MNSTSCVSLGMEISYFLCSATLLSFPVTKRLSLQCQGFSSRWVQIIEQHRARKNPTAQNNTQKKPNRKPNKPKTLNKKNVQHSGPELEDFKGNRNTAHVRSVLCLMYLPQWHWHVLRWPGAQGAREGGRRRAVLEFAMIFYTWFHSRKGSAVQSCPQRYCCARDRDMARARSPATKLWSTGNYYCTRIQDRLLFVSFVIRVSSIESTNYY